MTTIREDVMSAVNDGHTSVAAICEATGYESRQVVNALYQLKADKSVVAADDGLKVVDGKRAARVNGEAVPIVVKAKRKPGRPKKARTPPGGKKRAQAKRVKRKVDKRPAKARAPVSATPGRAAIDFTYFGEFCVVRRTDVAELLKVVEIIERWRKVVEAA
jgi:hypothetical protein